MSESAEYMQALKLHRQEEKHKRATANIAVLLNESGIPAACQSTNVYRIETRVGVVMYYPSTNKWQHKTKTHRGDVESFKAWVLKLL